MADAMRMGMRTIGMTVAGALMALGMTGTARASLQVGVQETGVVYTGQTSYLGLHLLSSTSPGVGPGSETRVDVYVSPVDLAVKNSQTGVVQKLVGFCVDPWNWSGSQSAPYFEDNLATMGTPANASYDIQQMTDPTHVQEIQSLYSNYYRGTVGNAGNSAAFQLALWELVSNNNVDHVSGTNQTIWNDAQGILNALQTDHYAMGAQQYDLTALYVNRTVTRTTGQNYLVAAPVSVPAPAMLGLVGMAAVGLAGAGLRRRRAAARG